MAPPETMPQDMYLRSYFRDRGAAMLHDPRGCHLQQNACADFEKVYWSDASEEADRTCEDWYPYTTTDNAPFQEASRHVIPPSRPNYPHAYSVEVREMQQYVCGEEGYRKEPPVYRPEHLTHYAALDGGARRGLSEAEVAYACPPQGGFVPAVPRIPRIHVVPTHGYPCGPVVCPPAPMASLAPNPSLTPWMYPCQTTPSAPPYPYTPNVACIPTTSVYPMVYPQPVLLRYVAPPAMPSRLVPKDKAATEGGSKESAADRPLLTALASNGSPLNANATEASSQLHERTTSSARSDRISEKVWSGRSSASHAHTVSSSIAEDPTTQLKLSCVNDRVLTSFKTNKTDTYKITVLLKLPDLDDGVALKDIRGHLLAFCLDQAGSRFIQDQLALCKVSEIDAVHEELAMNALNLMRDVFGNYIIQILLQNGSAEHVRRLAGIVKEHTVSLSLHVYGCRVVQKALEVLEEKDRLDIVRNLEAHVTRCIKDMNGNHVIQKAIRVFELDAVAFIVQAVQERVLAFSVHPYGCRVVQRILERDGASQEQDIAKEKIMANVVDNVGELSQDLYGNYVVQHVLRFSSKLLREQAIEALMSAPVDFACHKYASNVLEQALLSGDRAERQKIVQAIISSSRCGDTADALSMLTTNRFGNYVVQRMLDVVEDDLKCMLVSSIAQRMRTLKKFKYGKHIVSRVEKMLQPTSEAEEVSEGDSFCAYTVV